MDWLKALYVWKVDETKGHKPWEDPALIALFVSAIANLLTHYGITLSSAEQQAVVQAIVLAASIIAIIVCRLISPHVGIRPQTAAEVAKGVPSATTVDPQAGSAATQVAEASKIISITGAECHPADGLVDDKGRP